MNVPLPPLVLSAGCLLACSSTEVPSPDGSGGAANTGGAAVGAGGASTGGSATGGASSTGGSGTGGMTTGGTIAGGAATGGATGSGGLTATGGGSSGGDGAGGSNGGGSTGGSSGLSKGACTLGAGNHMEMGRTEEQYLGVDVTRDGKSYRMITNGWGDNWLSHDMSWQGTTLTIHSYEGSRQSNGAPAGFPTVFCGRYSDQSQPCGLPMALSEVTALNTAAAWSHPDGNGTYNVSYDVWLGDGNTTRPFGGLESYFMVWMRDPAGEQPAGSLHTEDVVVTDIPGQWDIIAGTVNNLPIVNYVRAEGDDVHEMAFDIMDFIRDAQSRELTMPGDDVLAIAIGFEIWAGPVTNLSLDDFCIDIQ